MCCILSWLCVRCPQDHAALDKNVALQLQLLSTKMDNMESKMASIVEGNMATREQLSSMQAQLTHLIGVLPKPLPHAQVA